MSGIYVVNVLHVTEFRELWILFFLLSLILATSQQTFHTYNNQNLCGMLGQSKQQKFTFTWHTLA